MGMLSLCVIIVLLQACTTARLTDKEIPEAKITLKELLELEGTEHESGLKALNKRIRTDCSSTTGSFSGIEYASLGYNVIRGYPLTAGRDPGFTSPIFNPAYQPPRYSHNCEFQLPHGFYFQPVTACATYMSSEEISTKEEFDTSLSISAHVEGEGWGASFSASTEYKNSVSSMKETNSITVLSDAICKTYYAQLDTSAPPQIADGFLADVRKLQEKTDDDSYLHFIDTHGTHFIKDMTFGARFSYRYDMTSEQYNTLSDTSYSIEVQASYSGVYSASGGVGMGQEERKAAENFQKNVKTSSYSIGAQPSSDGNVLEWASAVDLNNPMPLFFSLETIEDLFTDTYFGDYSDIDYSTIRDHLIKVKPMYIEYLKDRGEVETGDSGPIKVCTFSPYQRIPCIGDYSGIQRQQCESLGCCFDDTVSGVHYCFEEKGACATLPYERVACRGAYGGISSHECHALGCCFDDNVHGVPWCFPYTSEPVDQNLPELDCSGSAYQRIACIGAYGGIDMRTCESMDCCFDDSVPNTHWCFSPKGVCDGSPYNRVVCPGAYGGITASDCHKKGCCFDSRVSGVPYCYIQ